MGNRSLKLVLVLPVVVLGLCGSVRSEVFSWMCENDARIDKDDPDANFGQEAGGCNPGTDRTAFLMSWDFSSLAGWYATTDGTLTIPNVYWRQTDTCAGLYPLIGGAFQEDTVTYNSYVGADGVLPDVLGDMITTQCGDKNIRFHVPQATMQVLIDGTIDGLALSNPAGGYWNHCLNSGEGADQEPFLEFIADPEPPVDMLLVVDDMETYGFVDTPGLPGSRIWYIWRDGEGWILPTDVLGNGTGSVVDLSSDMAREGLQSMRYDYDNDGTNVLGTPDLAFYSELTVNTVDLPIGSDWTIGGSDVNTLALYFYGQTANAITEPMYVTLTDGDTPSQSQRVVYDGDANDVQQERWQLWKIPLADFTNVNAANIAEMIIGFGNPNATAAGGAGTVFFDQIRLIDPNHLEGQPVAWYQLEDGSGNTAVDTMGKYDADLRNPIWLPDSGFDGRGCLEFDDNQALGVPREAIAENITTAITIALWARWDQELPGADWRPMMSMNNTSKMVIFCPTPIPPKFGNGPQVHFSVKGDGKEDITAWGDSAQINQLAGEWTHWAFTKDCVKTEMALYANGQRVGFKDNADKVTAIPIPEDGTQAWEGRGLNFGGRAAFHGWWGQGDGNGKGWMDDIRIYDYALSDVEITELVLGGGP